jgi:hypothetical protein
MAIISLDPDVVIDYIPEYGGNKESDKPCIVRMRPLTYAQGQEMERRVLSQLKGAYSAAKENKVRQGEQKKVIVKHVESLENYFVGDKSVADAQTFYNCADVTLLVEILEALMSNSKLSEGQLKNSEPLSVINEPKAASSTVTPAPTPTESKETAPTVTVLKEA